MWITIEEPLIRQGYWNELRNTIINGAYGDVYLPIADELILADLFFEIRLIVLYPRRPFLRPRVTTGARVTETCIATKMRRDMSSEVHIGNA